MSAWWPQVQQRLVELLPTLTGWDDVVVHDGPGLSEVGAKQWVTVGHVRDGDGGSYTLGDGPVTTWREETGSVRGELVVWSGDTVIATERATAFALLDELDDAIRADQRLDVLPAGSTSELEVTVVSSQDTTGAAQRLIWSVNYLVRS